MLMWQECGSLRFRRNLESVCEGKMPGRGSWGRAGVAEGRLLVL